MSYNLIGEIHKLTILSVEDDLCTVKSDHKGKAILLKKKEEEFDVGQKMYAFVFDFDSKHNVLKYTTRNRGFLPITKSQQTKYLKALKNLRKYIENGKKIDPSIISEVKGMFNRCLKKNQADWAHVYKSFGYPNYKTLAKLVNALTHLRKFISGQNEIKANKTSRNLRDNGILTYIGNSLSYISDNSKVIPSVKNFRRKDIPHLLSRKEITSTYVQNNKAKMHNDLINKFAELAKLLGYSVTESKEIDLLTESSKSSFLLEAKAINDKNELQQVRKAISQLYEYRFLYNKVDSQLIILFDKNPQIDWIIDYLEKDRDIWVFYYENGNFHGNFIAKFIS